MLIIVIPRSWKGVLFYLLLGLFFAGIFIIEETQKANLNNFQSRPELVSFLKKDSTNNLIWSTDFTCEDFSKTLIGHAKMEGYRLEMAIVSDPNRLWPYAKGFWLGDEYHAVCIAYIEKEEQWVYLEPQSDEILGYCANPYEHLSPFYNLGKQINDFLKTMF